MKQNIDFTFKFKGDRNYVHGTDLYEMITNYLKAEEFDEILNIEMSFHQVTKNQMSGILYSEDEIIEESSSAFHFSFICKGIRYYILLNENDHKINDRYPYDEDRICMLSEYNEKEKKIKLIQHIGNSNIEKIVALNKRLLENLFPEIKGKWYFSRLQLDHDFKNKEYEKFEIQLKRNMNFKLTKSLILLDNEKIGFIYFTLN